MTARIHLLPAALADQIAAGEVIERPASVVKELVENSLDAGARRVEVEIEQGGLALICVADDGGGMTPEEAHLALRRHATSKLHSAEELFALASFGFRGEALPSIASIAQLTLRTRQPEAIAGYEVVVVAGEVRSAQEVGAPPGTRVEARELFANVPARLKFQKAAGTEAGHVVEVVARASLTAPGVHLRLRVDGRLLLELPPHASLGERAQAMLRRSAGHGVKLSTARLQEGAITVEVHVAPPEASVHSARRVHLLVNRRVVRDRGLLAAVQVGYGELLPRGRHPLAVIALSVPPGDVDINVHPQKLEVRLARAAEVYAAVRHAIARAVATGEFRPLEGAPEPLGYTRADAEPLIARDEDDEPPPAYAPERGRAFEAILALAGGAAASDEAPITSPSRVRRFLGALPGGYLAFVDAGGLAIVDQHAASALVLWASARPVDRIAAAFPLTLSEAERALLVDRRALLEELGFSLSADLTRLDGAPAWAERAREALLELVAALADGGDDEARARATTFRALSPAAMLDDDRAHALWIELERLERTGELPPLAEARWRGRRALILVTRSELTRRLNG